MKPKGWLLSFTTVSSQTYPHLHPLNENRLPIVAAVLEATLLASSTGKFETLGSNFSNETVRFACVLCYYIGKSNSTLLVPN